MVSCYRIELLTFNLHSQGKQSVTIGERQTVAYRPSSAGKQRGPGSSVQPAGTKQPDRRMQSCHCRRLQPTGVLAKQNKTLSLISPQIFENGREQENAVYPGSLHLQERLGFHSRKAKVEGTC